MPATNRKRTGSGGLFTKVIWFVGIGALLIGFFSVPASPSAEGIWQSTISRSQTIHGWFQNCAGKAIKGDFKCNATPINDAPGIILGPTGGTTAPASPTATP